VDSHTVSDPDDRVLTLRGDLTSAAAMSPFLQIEVEWTSVSDWAPVLTGVWAEYAMFDRPARRRRWTMQVMARDGLVQRDGSLSAKSGRQQIADLWTAWEGNQTVLFDDIDFDSAPISRQVRIIDIEESVAVTFDAGEWGESAVRLGLVEV
jgi:hypothetical protein